METYENDAKFIKIYIDSYPHPDPPPHPFRESNSRMQRPRCIGILWCSGCISIRVLWCSGLAAASASGSSDAATSLHRDALMQRAGVFLVLSHFLQNVILSIYSHYKNPTCLDFQILMFRNFKLLESSPKSIPFRPAHHVWTPSPFIFFLEISHLVHWNPCFHSNIWMGAYEYVFRGAPD